MENELIIIDTDFLIEYLYCNTTAVEIVDLNNSSFFVIGFTTAAELIKGTQNREQLQKLSKKMKLFHIVPIDEEISDRALELVQNFHLSHNAAVNDCLLAATALKYHCYLATCNTKHFAHIPNLLLLEHNVIPIRKSLY